MVWGCFSWFGQRLHHTMTFQMILCFQLCGNRLGKACSCFSMTMPPCTTRGPYRNGLLSSVSKNLTGLHRALTSTPSNTFGINWNADGEPGLIAQHQCLTSLMLLWLNGSKSQQQCSNIQWKAFPEQWRPLQQQRGDQLHINAHDFGMRCSTIDLVKSKSNVICHMRQIQQVQTVKCYLQALKLLILFSLL